MIDLDAVFSYARRFADRSEAAGRGTQFPTVRMAAKRFRCRQQDILSAVEASSFSGGYLGLAVGTQISGGGHAEFDSPADYEIEAYKE